MIWLNVWALLGLGGIAVLALWRSRWTGAGLPGDWSGIVAPELRAALLPSEAPGRGVRMLCLAIAAILILALARPAVEGAGGGHLPLGGRVLVLDLGPGADAPRLRLGAAGLIEQSAAVPTALVAVAADAYAIVPLTGDGAAHRRYLPALEPGIMPSEGRALHLGLARADSMLRRAGAAVGQIVLLTTLGPPQGTIATKGAAERIIVPLKPGADWQRFAEAQGARVVEAAALGPALAAAERRIARLEHRNVPGRTLPLTPILIALAALGWLALFRRQAAG